MASQSDNGVMNRHRLFPVFIASTILVRLGAIIFVVGLVLLVAGVTTAWRAYVGGAVALVALAAWFILARVLGPPDA
jgi:uncharacterized membrane protein YkgB